MTNPAAHLALILTSLRAVIAPIASKDWSRTAFLCFVWGRINRAGQRFQRLFTRWQAGSLPTPRAPRLARVTTPRPAAIRLPEGRRWLLNQLPHTAAVHANYLRIFLATPELREFLAAAPQAGRLLRPLCRMLGVNFEKPFGVPLPPLPAKPGIAPPPDGVDRPVQPTTSAHAPPPPPAFPPPAPATAPALFSLA